MIEIELQIVEYFQDQWQKICRTTEPKEILAHIAALTVCMIFIIILTFYQPILMGIAIGITLTVGIAVGVVCLGHHKLKDWVTQQCADARSDVAGTILDVPRDEKPRERHRTDRM